MFNWRIILYCLKDLEVVPDSSKIYYEEPKKVPSYQYPEPDPPKYAYYEPSEYSTKKIVPAKVILRNNFWN